LFYVWFRPVPLVKGIFLFLHEMLQIIKPHIMALYFIQQIWFTLYSAHWNKYEILYWEGAENNCISIFTVKFSLLSAFGWNWNFVSLATNPSSFTSVLSCHIHTTKL
jgi:hypothetical protein